MSSNSKCEQVRLPFSNHCPSNTCNTIFIGPFVFQDKRSHRLLEDRSRTYSNLPSHMSQSTDFLSPSKCTLENLRVRATSVSLLLIWKCRRKKKFSNLNKCQITSATGSNFFFLSIFLSCKWKLRAMTVFYMLCQGIANTGCQSYKQE